MLPDGLALNPLERFIHDLHDNCGATGVFTAAARFRGRVTPDRLSRALAAIQQRHPLLRASLQRQGRSWAYRIQETPPAIPIEWVESTDRERWSTEIVARARVPFDASTGPFLRVAVLQGAAADWCDILFTMHHMIADGRAILTIIRDLQQVWSVAESAEARLEPQTWVPPKVPPLPRRRGDAWRRLLSARALRRANRGIPAVRLEPLNPPGMFCRREVFSTEETTRLRGRCREEQTTLYGALAAAAVQSLAQDPRYAGQRFSIDSPVDFRTLCEPRISPEQVGCYVWIMRYQTRAPEQVPFWELARRCREELETARQDGRFQRIWKRLPWLVSLVSAQRAEALRRRLETGLVSINDMGAVRPVASCTDLVLEEFGWYSNREHTVPTFVVNAILVEGRLNLTLSSPCHTPADLSAIAAELRGGLVQFSAARPASGDSATIG